MRYEYAEMDSDEHLLIVEMLHFYDISKNNAVSLVGNLMKLNFEFQFVRKYGSMRVVNYEDFRSFDCSNPQV